MSTIIPHGSGPTPPPGHSKSNSNIWGTSGATGALRFNTTTNQIEVWDSTQWLTVTSNPDPETWREWLVYHSEEIIDHGDLDAKLKYILKKMQERFPGNYTIKHLADGKFDLDFCRPEDETWFHLKYD